MSRKWRISNKRIEATILTREYFRKLDFPVKRGDRMFAFFEASYRIRQRYHIMASAELDTVDASDPRSAYDRNQFSIGMRWSL